jgi:hypothetical protein
MVKVKFKDRLGHEFLGQNLKETRKATLIKQWFCNLNKNVIIEWVAK